MTPSEVHWQAAGLQDAVRDMCAWRRCVCNGMKRCQVLFHPDTSSALSLGPPMSCTSPPHHRSTASYNKPIYTD
eukprot:12885639-Prorocentrum_lima.AAC.1